MDDPLLRQAQLVNASRLSAIGELAAALSHEINNPLAVIMGRAEMMQELLKSGKGSPARFEKMLDEIQITARRIENIIKSIHRGQLFFDPTKSETCFIMRLPRADG